MTSVSPAEGTLLSRPTMRSTIAGTLHYVAGHIPLVSRLSTIFKEMITVAFVVVMVVGLILYLYSVPPYSHLKVTRAPPRQGSGAEMLGNHTSQYHPVPEKGKIGLLYFENWRVNHWGLNFVMVRIHYFRLWESEYHRLV
jgi:hypothetical protein